MLLVITIMSWDTFSGLDWSFFVSRSTDIGLFWQVDYEKGERIISKGFNISIILLHLNKFGLY